MLLPVVERELRVAARQPATHWARFGAAAAVMLVVLFPLLSEGGVSRQTGSTLVISGSGLPKEVAMVCIVLWVALGVGTAAVAVGRPRWELKHLFRALAAGDESAVKDARKAQVRVV
jgi:hypothetical protein